MMSSSQLRSVRGDALGDRFDRFDGFLAVGALFAAHLGRATGRSDGGIQLAGGLDRRGLGLRRLAEERDGLVSVQRGIECQVIGQLLAALGVLAGQDGLGSGALSRRSLALAGLPPLAGFFSKDEIWVVTTEEWGGWAAILFGVAALFTAIYSTRLFIRTFLGKPKNQHVYEHTHESNFLMTGPLIFLCTLAILSGWVIFHDVGSALGFPGGITEFIFLHEPHRYHIDWGYAAASGATAFGGIFFAAWLYWGGRLDRSTVLARFQPAVYKMLQRKFYFDDLYQGGIDRGMLGFSYLTSWFDRYVVNDTGVDGTAQLTGYGGYILKHFQTGKLPNYAMGIALGVVILAVAGLAVRA